MTGNRTIAIFGGNHARAVRQASSPTSPVNVMPEPKYVNIFVMTHGYTSDLRLLRAASGVPSLVSSSA